MRAVPVLSAAPVTAAFARIVKACIASRSRADDVAAAGERVASRWGVRVSDFHTVFCCGRDRVIDGFEMYGICMEGGAARSATRRRSPGEENGRHKSTRRIQRPQSTSSSCST
jgi:hypothetical protein